MPAAGTRANTGSWYDRSTGGTYWSSTVSGTGAFRLHFNSGTNSVAEAYRAYGHSVRCIQK
ncbi:MAG: hypothetical protein LBR26_01895 [Prevotella sp.]|nr:hypothetical protein [Prevotella sp.]